MNSDAFAAIIGDELPRAVEHAGLSPDRVKLWTCIGWAKGDRRAVWFKPNMTIDEDRVLSEGQKHDADLPEHRGRHRIAIFRDAPVVLGATPALLGALLRHELEHARQFDIAGEAALDIDAEFLEPAMRHMVGGLPGSNVYYNLKPAEMDANAAAAQYLRDYHSAAVETIRASEWAQLARAHRPPNDPATLLARTVACLYLFRDICTADTGPVRFDKRLHVYDPRAGHLWRELERLATQTMTTHAQP